MRFTMNGYEIEIKAKYTAGGAFDTDKRMNKADTLSVINSIALWAFEASNHYHDIGLLALSEYASDAGAELHEQLEEAGAFKR